MSRDAETLLRLVVEEVLNKGNYALLDDLVSPSSKDHSGGEDGPEGYRETIEFARYSFPDLHMTIDEVFGAGDKIAFRYTMEATHKAEYMGIPASGRRVKWEGMGIIQAKDGQIVERWNLSDTMRLLHQLRG